MNQAPLFNAQFFAQVVDGSPLVAAGYRLHTYASGTTTPQATYQDQAGATPNANPIILDADGRCSLWLDPALEYTFELRTSAGGLVRTWDDVVGTASTTSVVTSVNGDTGAVTLAALDMEFVEANGYTWLTATNAEDAINQVAERANSPTAGTVTIEDTAGDFTATNVEDALAELYALASVDSQSGRLLQTRYFTATGAVNYTKPTGVGFIIVEMVGGGAASYGLELGGSAGGYCKKRIAIGDLDGTTILTVGAGGTTDGVAGGDTSFGSHCSATGGGASAGVGGVGIGGDLNLRGGNGGYTVATGGIKYGHPVGGYSFFGNGGQNTGGGGRNVRTVGGSEVGPGYSGMVIIYEYS